MSGDMDWDEVTRLIEDLYTASDGLLQMFPGRKFTLDGHLVGSIGEVVAAYMFDLELNTASTLGHDAKARDGRDVEIKFTQGNRVAIRHEPDHLIVLHRPKDGKVRVVFNGPGNLAWKAAGKKQTNGQCQISLSRLSKLDVGIPDSLRLPLHRSSPI
jgi:hypothetical protein